MQTTTKFPLQVKGKTMQHYMSWPINSTAACGANMVGRRNSRTDSDPSATTCRLCKESEEWKAGAASARIAPTE